MKKSKNKLIYVGRKDPHFYSMTAEEYSEYTELYTILTEATKLLLRKVPGVSHRCKPIRTPCCRSSQLST
jgi:hypothetical protein